MAQQEINKPNANITKDDLEFLIRIANRYINRYLLSAVHDNLVDYKELVEVASKVEKIEQKYSLGGEQKWL